MASYPAEAMKNGHGFDEGVEGEVPTHGNSTKQTAPSTPAEVDSPANIGDASC